MRRRTAAVIATYLLAAGSAGCALLSWVSGPKREIPFTHATHAKKEIACVVCHAGAETENRAGMPDKEVCLTCHGPKPDRPPTDYEERILKATELKFESRNASPDVIFSHARHFEKGYACVACHGKVEETTEVDATFTARMDNCTTCHGREGVRNDCAACHTVLREDEKPPTHVAGFLKMHGREVRGAADGLAQKYCLYCHAASTRNSCEKCHAEMPPDDHTNFFRRKGHGFQAEVNRDTCFVCHREDSCIRCHEQVTPSTHVGSWGGTFSSHCLSCHQPLQANACFVCHKSTAPHKLAPPKPPPPHPGAGAVCTACHIPGSLLKHADNGENCNNCHK